MRSGRRCRRVSAKPGSTVGEGPSSPPAVSVVLSCLHFHSEIVEPDSPASPHVHSRYGSCSRAELSCNGPAFGDVGAELDPVCTLVYSLVNPFTNAQSSALRELSYPYRTGNYFSATWAASRHFLQLIPHVRRHITHLG